jgi:hypothetical protein
MEFTENGIKLWRYYGIGSGVNQPYTSNWFFESSIQIVKPFTQCASAVNDMQKENKNRAVIVNFVTSYFATKKNVPQHLAPF